MATPYRDVLGVPGAVAFSLAGLVARLPLSMAGIGIVVLVAARTGSYGYAGALSATYLAANAAMAVPLARVVDHWGQHRVLGPAASLSALGVALLVVAVESGWPAPWPYVSAVLAGATLPNVGAAVRARWSHVIRERRLLDTAFAVEAVNDEMVFIVGPTAVTLLAALVHPWAGLATAATASVLGTWMLARQRRTEPPSGRQHPATDRDGVPAQRPAMPWGRLAPLVGGAVLLGVLFGGTEVAVVAFADEAGRPALAGVLLAAWALGSLLAGIVSGSVSYRRSPPQRFLVGACALTLLLAPLPLLPSLAPIGAMLFLAGFAISPTLIAAISWVESFVPTRRLNEGMTAVSTALTAGVAPGAAVVGVVVDRWSPSAGFVVPAAAGLLTVAVAALATGVGKGDQPLVRSH